MARSENTVVSRIEACLLEWLQRRSYGSLLRLGGFLGHLWYYLIPVRAGLIDENLKLAFPHSTSRWRKRVRHGCCLHYARMMLELIWQRNMNDAWIKEHVSWVNAELPARLLAQGRGAIAVGGHFGNWEVMGGAATRSGFPVSYIVKRIHDPVLDQVVNAARASHGVEIIYTREAGRQVLKHFARNRLVAFLADQDAGTRGVFVPLLGRPASTRRGAALYALRTGAPMIFVSCRRVGRDHFEVEFVEIPVDASWTACDEHVAALTARFTALLEERIRVCPEQWFWMHHRWKTPPPPDGGIGYKEE